MPTLWEALPNPLWRRALALPQVRHFWRDHPRLVGLPIRHVEIANSPAVLAGFESISNGAKIEVAFSRTSFELVHLNIQ